MDRVELYLPGEACWVIGCEVVRDGSGGDHTDDEKRREPVEGLCDGAVGGCSIGKGHLAAGRLLQVRR